MLKITKRYPYEIIPGHYASPARYTFQRNIYPLLMKILQEDDTNILDFGCGFGMFRFYFHGRNYYGFDIANRDFDKKKGDNYNFIISNGTMIPFKDNFFDFVFCNAVLEHVEDNTAAAKEAARVLRSGKYCIVIVPTKYSVIYDEIPFWPLELLGLVEGHAEHYYSKKELKRLIEDCGMEVIDIFNSMGFFSSILKIVYIYTRFPRYLWYNMLLKWFGRESGKRDLYIDSKVKYAINRDDLFEIQEREYKNTGLLRRLYRFLLEICFFLDQKLKIPVAGEWGLVARKK